MSLISPIKKHHRSQKKQAREEMARGRSGPRLFPLYIELWPYPHRQILTNKQRHIVRPTGITERTPLPPPLPDVPHGQTQIERCTNRGSITIAQPEPGTDTAIRRLTRTIHRLA